MFFFSAILHIFNILAFLEGKLFFFVFFNQKLNG